MKNILALFVLLISCSPTKEVIQDQQSFFKSFEKQSKKNKCSIYSNDFEKNRKAIINEINFLKFEKGSKIFILQEYNIQTAEFNESIWQIDNRFEYIKSPQELEVIDDGLFPEYYYGLIEKWNVEKIKEYEKKYSNNFGANMITAYKVEVTNTKELKFNCINFKYFYSPALDVINH